LLAGSTNKVANNQQRNSDNSINNSIKHVGMVLGARPELQLRCAVKAEPMTLAVPTTSISSCLRLRCGAHGVFPKSAAGFLCPMQQPAECAGQKLTVAGDEIADGRAGLCESGTGAAQRCLRVG
jgi:hypothetical protein